jgi:hypothetical protein
MMDITVPNYRIGSLGGPFTNIIQVFTALLLLRWYSEKFILNMVFNFFLLVTISYFLKLNL